MSDVLGEQTQFTCRQAVLQDIPALVPLFDDYRQFYQCPSDRTAASAWLTDNLDQHRSVIFMAEAQAGSAAEGSQQASQEKHESNPAIGFTQLYPALCSVDLVPYYVLYDLFVLPAARKHGVAIALMNAAADFARGAGAARLDLETAHTNQSAKSLYLKLGYQADTTFQKYSLELT
jgi:ribosomal protein S18 acetylase RimI-like enzyme